ncbi:MAG TPA: HutD family protein [Parvularculaceae bacterium]|nr:HutD family protein [Parvularculaceae bacterium]
MRIVEIESLPLSPWKNGGGVTREVAQARDEKGLVWRLSFAEVERDGAFSIFAGLERVLTVLSGAGLILRHENGKIEATPGSPVRFSGDLAIDCALIDGPVRDFNLIYDPARTAMDVVRLDGGVHETRACAVLPLASACAVEGGPLVQPGSILLNDDGCSIRLRPSGPTLVVVNR